MLHSKNRIALTLLVLVLIGALLRFYNLNWGAPYYFHPDERNIASSISQLQFPSNMNPHFFAYGSFPIYFIFLKALSINLLTICSLVLTQCSVSFEQAIILGRIFSAFLSTLLIPLVYIIGKKIHGTTLGIIASFLTTFSTGLIQYAHFATFEIWTTFFATLQLLLTIQFLQKKSKIIFYLLSFVTGLLVSIKISNAVLIVIPISVLIVEFFKNEKNVNHSFLRSFTESIFMLFFLLLFVLGVFVFTNPYSVHSFDDFQSSINYESSVALGTLDVFYTGEFHNTIPVIFQSMKVFPFLMNPAVFLTGVAALFYTTYIAVKKKSVLLYFLLLSFYLLFTSQAFMYVKWVRYMVPTLPFLYLIIAFACVTLYGEYGKSKIAKTIFRFGFMIIVLSCALFSFSYIYTVFVEQDTRVAARNSAREMIPPGSTIISEVYDMGIVPFNENFKKITLFNFYDLDTQGENVRYELDATLQSAEYLILPSQRLLATRLSNENEFPRAAAFYRELLENNNRYTKIYETPCFVLCQITYLGDPISRFEGTANVFDHPHVMIFKIHE